ncbi:hypothetical protein R5H32_16070 [Defluviimonas sp. D31]|uniref:head-tail connector protein n=1 Tax=Defluviimonas sp. D31 TaxID=3083253 RepID=UPI00296FED79|nr:hypothetical protein [Defluviimonas sp. D31]MDW4550879.1 hypothetical protein [Defluviimonas sp. D31]
MPAILKTPPAVLPVSRDELKAHLRVTSEAEDATLDACLEAATAEIDGLGLLGRAMISATYEQLSAPRAGWLELEITPPQSLTAITFTRADGSTFAGDPAAYPIVTDGERHWLAPAAWPAGLGARPDAIRATYVAGFGAAPADVPAPLRHAVKLLAAHRFEIREEVIIGAPVAQVPAGVDRLLALYRVRVFG